MRQVILIVTVVAAMAAAGLVLAGVGAGDTGSDQTEEVDAAAQPPDNPGDTAPGRPTTTTEPGAEPTVEQATIRGFGTACSSDDLCLEIGKPYHLVVCDDNGQNCIEAPLSWEHERANLVGSGWSEASAAGQREVALLRRSFRGEKPRTATGVTVCHIASAAPAYRVGYGKTDGAFTGQLAVGTPPLDLPGVTMYQFEVSSPSFGEWQIFVTEPTDVTVEEFGDLVSEFEMTEAEIEAASGRPYSSPLPICDGPPEEPPR